MPIPGNRIFPEKIQEIPSPKHLGTSYPRPGSVPAFGTGQLPSRLSPENEMGKIPEIWYWTGNFLLGTEICYINGCSTIFCLILQKPKNKKPFQDKLASLAAGAIFKPVFTLFDKNSIF